MAQKINLTQIDTDVVPKNGLGIPIPIVFGNSEYENYLKAVYSEKIITQKIDAETYEVPNLSGDGFTKVILWNPITKQITYGDPAGHHHNNLNVINKFSEVNGDLKYDDKTILTNQNVTNYVVNDKHYKYEQPFSSKIWTIIHNLNKECSVTVRDSANTVVLGKITINNGSKVVIEFNKPFVGTAVLN